MVKKDPKITASEISARIQDYYEKEVHPNTIRRILHKGGYHARVPRTKTHIKEVNRTKRLEFANEYVMKDSDFWDKVIFSDE